MAFAGFALRAPAHRVMMEVSKGNPLSMKAGIHPAYEEVNVVCACGNTSRPDPPTRATSEWKSALAVIPSLPAARNWWTPKAAWTASRRKSCDPRTCRKRAQEERSRTRKVAGYFWRLALLALGVKLLVLRSCCGVNIARTAGVASLDGLISSIMRWCASSRARRDRSAIRFELAISAPE